MGDPIRILLLADSHLGFDLPSAPRAARRRRGHDFLANYGTALAPALAGGVDLVVHGGDVFDRPHVPASLAWQGLAPLVRVADSGVPVFIVPGNHERSRLPHRRFAAHPRVHVFDRARTFVVTVRGVRVALTGFPFERGDVRTRLPELLETGGWRRAPADVRLLCMHQCVEGATVGPGDFTFTSACDVVRCADVPDGFAAVLSGHIHRRQALVTDLTGRPLAVPVLYPGSIERTSLAEIGEPKGYLVVDVGPGAGRARVRWQWRDLPARPMLAEDVRTDGVSAAAFEAAIRSMVAAAPADAVLHIRVHGRPGDAHLRSLRAQHLRTFVPATMNVVTRLPDGWRPGSRRHAASRSDRRPAAQEANLRLPL